MGNVLFWILLSGRRTQGGGGAARIRFSVYERAIAAPTVFHSRAAYNWRSKIITLSEELRRRYGNRERLHTSQEMDAVVGAFFQKLANSGYDRETRTQILRSAMVKFYRKILDSKMGGHQLYRSSSEIERARRFKGLELKK